ncbi:hypothetical protein PZ897_02185 [Hoeflea sp. YIM 152468]|uniref:hypothetical protein n=1 Tax=Hoeflea sp. YIM 152468 TaxID=3031759 RepID=UPI0023DC7859|nr:hypothetical protein [Hoeflea sp. YIM 152468]MDF1606980.1 hypothetical protein [Hoeflea sp. YIM 152468]
MTAGTPGGGSDPLSLSRPDDPDISFAGGASSSRASGDAAAASGRGRGPAHPPPAPGLELVDLARERRSHTLPAGGAAGADARSGLRPAAVDLVTLHISADAAGLLALLAAEHGESLSGAVARLVVAEIERKGGIAHV